MSKNVKIQALAHPSGDWDPAYILLDREIGYERDTGLAKMGDGITQWSNLPYIYFGNNIDVVVEEIENGVTITFTKEDGEIQRATIYNGLKGKEGYTPIKGIDYFTPEERASIINEVIDSFGGAPVHGYVDADNNIVISGNLTAATYIVNYEDENGNLIHIGDLIIEDDVYYSVTNNLTNCINNNKATWVIGGQSYVATIVPNDGYVLSSITVTMNGEEIAVSEGNINIVNVTGNINITAEAKEIEITNWVEVIGYTENTRLSLSSGNTTSASDYECTGFISAKYGDVLYIQNIDLTNENATNIIFYDNAMKPMAVNGSSHGITLYWLFVANGTQTGDMYSSTLETRGSLSALPEDFDGYIRIGSKSITNQSVVNIKRNGIWL